MALGKQTISINFSKGLDTKTDNKQVIPGKMLTLENAVLKKVGKFIKRNGYGVIANNQGINNGNSLATFKNELIAYDGDYIYSYSDSDDKLYSKGTKVAVDLATQSVARNSYEQTQPDCSVHSADISVYAWQDSSGGVRYSIFDVVTQQAIVSNKLINATGSKPKVKVLGAYVLVFFIDGTDLKYYPIDSTDPTAVSSEATIASTVAPYYDVKFFNSLMYVAWSTGTTICIVTLNSTLVQSATLTVSAVSSCLGIFNDPSDNIWVAYASGNDLKYFIYDKTLVTQVLAPTTIETGTAPFVNVTGVFDVSQGLFFYEVTGDIASNQYIKTNTGNSSGTVDTPYVFFRSVGLYSKIFKHNGSNYMVLTHQSDLQPTYFVVNLDQKVVAKIAPALGGGLSTSGLLAEVNLVGTDQYIFAYEYKDFVQSVAGDVTTQTGVNGATLNFSEAILNQEIGNNLHSSGGVISAYDGQSINELGFNLYPESLDASFSIYEGFLKPEIYQYLCVYEWTDAQGQIHRSAPSIPNSFDYTFNYVIFNCDTNNTITDRNRIEFNNPSQTILVNPGMKITGTGLPNPSYVSYDNAQLFNDFRYSTRQVYPFVTTAQNNLDYTFNSGKTFKGKTEKDSKTIYIRPNVQEYYFASTVAGSNIVTLSQYYPIKIGSEITYSPSVSTLYTYTVLSQNGVNLTISANFISTITNGCFSFRTNSVTLTGTIGSNIYTGTLLNISKFDVGDFVYFVYGTEVFYDKIISKTSTSITISRIATASSGQSFYICFKPKMPSVGEVYENFNNIFSGSVTVEEVNNIDYSIKVNKYATKDLPNLFNGFTGDGFGADFFSEDSIKSTVTIPSLRITEKNDVNISLYRTAGNGTLFYKVNTFQTPIINDKSVNYITYTDTVSDDVLLGNEQLYTTGGEVENIAPPASNVIGAYKNRLLVVPNEDSLSFWYSKQVRTNTPIEFNDSFVQRTPEKGGSITALQQMDDKLLIFKQDFIFVMVGDGPSVSGINNDFTDPQLITADAGCNDKKSVVVLPTGVIFKSQKGFYFLDRALNVKYIGADVEAFNSYSVTSARMIETENQVRFTISSGDTLVYDYYVEQWAVFKGINAADAVNFQDKYTYVVPSGEIRRETPSAYLDDTSFIPMKLETGWLNLAGLQGYTRIYHILLVGTYKSPHTLQVELYRDFIETPYETVTIPVLSAPTKYQYRIFPSIQKCESIKIKITELQTAPFGEGFDISAINLEVGVKRGQNRISPDESFG